MKYSSRTITMLTDMVTGDSRKVKVETNYNGGWELVKIFNNFGFNNTYGPGFPGRWYFANEKLRMMNEKEEIDKFLKFFFHPSRFLENFNNGERILKKANEYLVFDGTQLIWKNNNVQLIKKNETNQHKIDFNIITDEVFSSFIKKCDERIENNDFSGAITLSKTVLESLMKRILKENKVEFKKNINFINLSNQVKEYLTFHPDKKFNESLIKIFTGFKTILIAINEIRNIAGDSHGTSEKHPFKIESYQVKLIVNISKSLAIFLFKFLKTKK